MQVVTNLVDTAAEALAGGLMLSKKVGLCPGLSTCSSKLKEGRLVHSLK